MGCSGCSNNSGLPRGCKNNGACGTYGCNKLDVFDWLAGMRLPEGQKMFDVVEVRFKNSRKGFFRNSSNLELYAGDVVAVECSPGHDVGVISLTGELVRMQMKRKEIKDNYELKKIYRKAKEEDVQRWQEARKLEHETMMKARILARELGLDMKISDVEYQGDKSKATFYYTADDRVDFRELIRKYAETFRVRIEMRQIGLRIEAGRIGGIGSCGRELCCSTWLTDFRAVSTSAARYQQLSLNPAKLAGQCGKLKCCLNYELDQYVEALKDLPPSNVRLKLPKGIATHIKTDIFKRLMFYVYEGQPTVSPFSLTTDAVREIQEMNLKGIEVQDLDDFIEEEAPAASETEFAQVVGQDSLTRFDRKKKGRNHRGGKGQHRQGGDKKTIRQAGEGADRGASHKQQQQRRDQPRKDSRKNERPQPGANKEKGQRTNQSEQPPRNLRQGGSNKGSNRPPRENRPQGGGEKPVN